MSSILSIDPSASDAVIAMETLAGALNLAPAQADALRLPPRKGFARANGELFDTAKPPPPPPAAVISTAAPTAPPVPYRYAGKVGDDDVVLAKGERVFTVKAGEILDGSYRVEAIAPGRIDLLYLPLGTVDRIVYATADIPSTPGPAAPAVPTLPEVFDATPARLRWQGPQQVRAGEPFSVALRATAKQALRAAPMQIRYEPAVLEAVRVEPGAFFRDGVFTYRLMPGGSIFVGATAQPPAPAADAELVIVTFRPIKRGATAELSMSSLNLQGNTGRSIANEQVAAFRAPIQ